MDSFEWNKIIGAVLGTAIFVFVVRQVAEVVYEPEIPAKPGYVVQGVPATPASGAGTQVVAETIPDWGTVLPTADVAQGKSISARCEQCHDLSKGGPNKIGPNLYGVVDRPRATHPGFDYSSAMKKKGGTWTYDELFKFLKSPGAYIPGTKMTFAGLPREKDRVNLIAYLRSNADTPAPIPAPKPQSQAVPTSPAAGASQTTKGGAPSPASGSAPANAGKTASSKANTSITTKPATPAASSPTGGAGSSNPK